MNQAFKTSKGTVGYVLQTNKDIIDSIAVMSKQQALATLDNLFKVNSENISQEYATQVLQNASKKKSSTDILIYLYNILLAQQDLKVLSYNKETRI